MQCRGAPRQPGRGTNLSWDRNNGVPEPAPYRRASFASTHSGQPGTSLLGRGRGDGYLTRFRLVAHSGRPDFAVLGLGPGHLGRFFAVLIAGTVTLTPRLLGSPLLGGALLAAALVTVHLPGTPLALAVLALTVLA